MVYSAFQPCEALFHAQDSQFFFDEIHILGNPPGTPPYSMDGTQAKPTGFSFGNLTWQGHRVRP